MLSGRKSNILYLYGYNIYINQNIIPKRVYSIRFFLTVYPFRYYIKDMMPPTNQELSQFLKSQRRRTGLKQEDLALRAGVGLRFVRDLEQGKETLRLDKVNQVLALFGARVGVVTLEAGREEA